LFWGGTVPESKAETTSKKHPGLALQRRRKPPRPRHNAKKNERPPQKEKRKKATQMGVKEKGGRQGAEATPLSWGKTPSVSIFPKRPPQRKKRKKNPEKLARSLEGGLGYEKEGSRSLSYNKRGGKLWKRKAEGEKKNHRCTQKQ